MQFAQALSLYTVTPDCMNCMMVQFWKRWGVIEIEKSLHQHLEWLVGIERFYRNEWAISY